MKDKLAIVVRKELKENLRSVRYWAIIILFVLLYLASSYAVGFALRGFGGPIVLTRRTRAIMQLSSSVVNTMAYVAPLLGIALGFSAIAAEREKGTIRLLLARPIYRDDVVNGKVLAAVILIVLAIGLSMALATPLSVVLQGLNVTADDLLRLMLSIIPATLLALAYYAMALFASVNAGRSSHALVVSIAAWIFFAFLLPMLASFVAFYMLGPPPAMAFNATRPGQMPEQLREYYSRFQLIYSRFQLISPNDRYTSLANALFNVRERTEAYESLINVFSRRWIDAVVLLAYIAVFIALSHVFFVHRQETR